MHTFPVHGARRLIPALALTALTALTMSACGGDDDDGGADQVASLDDVADDTVTDESDTGDAGTDDSGTDDTQQDDAAAPSTTVDPEEALLDFAACMREHGVDMPDPTMDENGGVQIQIGAGPGEGPPANVDEAMEACEGLMPRMGPRDRDDFDPTEMQDEMLEFTRCMREHGVDIDDPTFDDEGRFESRVEAPPNSGEAPTGPVLAGPFGTLDMSNPDTEAAFDECSEGTMFGSLGDAGPATRSAGSDDE